MEENETVLYFCSSCKAEIEQNINSAPLTICPVCKNDKTMGIHQQKEETKD